MAKYGMVIDCHKCTGCYNCFLTCRDEFCGNEYPGYAAAQPMEGQNWIKVLARERGSYPKVKVTHTPVTCMQCDVAGCIKAARGGAVYRRPDGIVIIDPVKARGQKQIVDACPYRVIGWNEEKQLPQKCIFCAHMLDAGEKEPRCVESCPTGALVFGDLDDPASAVARLVATGKTEILHPEYGMKEKVTYHDLKRRFVAGTVIYGDKDECAVGLEVSLSQGGQTRKTQTDGFGDFEFEGLPEDTGCTVKIAAQGYPPREMDTCTRTDVYLGEIVL